MKKTTKLLSVLLAVVMMMSCFSMGAFAARTSYKTVSDLEALGAYSTDGEVTRLSTEDRLSIVFDALDALLANANIKVDPIDLSVLGKLTINLDDTDGILDTVDGVKALKDDNSFLFGIAGWMLGIIGDISFNSWQKGMDRTNNTHGQIIYELLELLNKNHTLISDIIKNGTIDLGIVGNYVDLSGVTKYISNLPGLINKLIFGLFGRDDDNSTEIANQLNFGSTTTGGTTLQNMLITYVNNLFTKNMSYTSYKEDAATNIISGHNALASEAGTRKYYVRSENVITAYYYDTTAAADAGAGYATNYYAQMPEQYVRTEELDSNGNGTGEFVFQNASGDNLKAYLPNSEWLPELAAAVRDGNIDISLANNSAADLLYKFIPYVYKAMAPVVLNGSCKKLIADWIGGTRTKIYEGKSTDAAAATAANALTADAKAFFTATAGDYIWEWSDYMVSSDGYHYYRFVLKDGVTEEWYKIDMSTANGFKNLINWNYEVPADLVDEFIPATEGATSAKGYTTILQGLNDFAKKAVDTMLSTEAKAAINWTAGDNSNIVGNLRKVINYFCALDPEALFGSGYQTVYAGYVDMLTNTNTTEVTNQETVTALAAILVKALMPQIALPSAANLEGQQFGAILACVIRELATELAPTRNYDALIYSNYNTKTLVAGKDNSYWLDVLLTMGIDIGLQYLPNLADMGEDDNDNGVTRFLGAKTYTAEEFNANPRAWENALDWIIDWALTSNKLWAWRFEKLVNTSGLTINLDTDEDPWIKLDKILTDILPVKQVLNCTAAEGQTWTETVLRDNFAMAIANLDFAKIVGDNSTTGLLNIPAGALRNDHVVNQIVVVVRDLLNSILAKVTGTTMLSTSTFTSLPTVLTQSGLATIVDQFLVYLLTAYNNGLLDPIVPFLNWFLGWSTNAQKLASPIVSFKNSANQSYVYTGESATNQVRFYNGSSGMLEKHGTINDSAYMMTITAITCSDSNFSVSASLPMTVAPGEAALFDINVSDATGRGAAVTFTYTLIGKDGSAIGAEQSYVGYTYITADKSDIISSYSDNNTQKKLAYVIVNYNGNAQVNYIATSAAGLSGLVSGISISWTNERDTDCKFTASSYQNFNTTYLQSSGSAEALVNKTLAAKGGAAQVVKPAALKTGLDVDTIPSGTTFAIGSVSSSVYGEYKLGIKYTATGSLTADLGSVYYYNADSVTSVYDQAVNDGRQRAWYQSNATADAAWAEYQAAMIQATALVEAPKMKATFSTVYTNENIEAAATRLEDAITALEALRAVSNIGSVKTTFESVDTDSVDYLNCELNSYFNYEKAYTNIESTINSFNAPTAPTAYIDGCWLNIDQINTAKAAAANDTIKAAIEQTKVQPSAFDIQEFEANYASWKAPTTSALDLADISSRFTYYYSVLGARGSTGKDFLAQEVACAEEQGYVEANYTAVSWARYAQKLADAKAVNNDSNATNSEVFDAKYGLMKAQRDLKLKVNDYASVVDISNLTDMISLAEGMLANPQYFDAVDASADETVLWANLLKAAGYVTNAVDTNNDGTVDANDDEVQLYTGSASNFVSQELYYPSRYNDTYYADKTNTLSEAIAALKCNIIVEKNDATTVVEQAVKTISNVAPLSLTNTNAVLARVKASDAAATLTVTPSALGLGTGTKVEATINGLPITTYYVVIYGDINGDGAIDGFDVAKADLNLYGKTSLTDVQAIAAEADKNGTFEVNDIAAIQSATAGFTTISQA